MVATLLLEDLRKANDDELAEHLNGLFAAPGGGYDPSNIIPRQIPVEPTPVTAEPEPPAPPPQELQDHVQSLFAAPSSTPAPAPTPAPTTPEPNVVQQLADHVRQSTGLQWIGEGITNLQGAAQQATSGLTNLRPPPIAPTPSPATQPSAGTTAPGPQGPLQDYARQMAQRYGVDPDIFVRQIQQESGFRPDARSPAGATGIAQFMPGTARGMGIDPTDPYASLEGGAQLMRQNLDRYGGDYAKALAAYNAGPGNVDKYGGVPPFEETQRYISTILGGTSGQRAPTPQQGLERAGAGIGGANRDISQFGDAQLTNSQAYAACGPAAAVRFAQRFGRNPTLSEAVNLARTVGWTEEQGMAGLSSEKALMDRMGVATKMVQGADWGTFANEARTGNPVTISTRGHYFTADGWDPATNRFHVGRSGLDLKGGSEWMTPEQMTGLMGPVQGGLLADNPQAPGSTVQVAGVQSGAQAAPEGRQGIQFLGDAPQSAAGFTAPGGPARGFLEQAAETVGSGFSRLGEVAQGGLRVLDDAVNATGTSNPTPASVPGRGYDPSSFRATEQPPQPGIPRVQPGTTAPASETLGEAGQRALEFGGDVLSGKYSIPQQAADARARLEEIGAKYPHAPGERGWQDRMTPSDRADYDRALSDMLMTVGGVTSPVETPMTRMYHGTGAAFDRPEPGRFVEGGLYGPGYYLTDEPRVAGGIVQDVTVPPATTAAERQRQFREIGIPGGGIERGAVRQGGYAQADMQSDTWRAVERWNRERQELLGELESMRNGPMRQHFPNADELVARWERELTEGDERVADLLRSGPNVRAVDVPENLRLLDVEKMVEPGDVESIRSLVPKERLGLFDTMLERATGRGQWRPTGQQVWDALNRGGTRGETNQLLAQAGYDGLRYPGGQLMAISDEAGRDVRHSATVIFPDSLDKLRNAISGRRGGASQLDLAAGVAGFAGLGALAASKRDDLEQMMAGFTAPNGDNPWPESVPGAGYDPSAFRAETTPPQEGIPLRQDVRDLGQQPQPTLLEQIGEAPGLSEADRAARRQALEESPLGQAYGSDIRKQLLPNITEPNHPANIIAELQDKYRDSTEPMTPEDQQRLREATLAIGGMAAPSAAPGRAASKAGRAIDYDALANLRRSQRARQPGLPDMPPAEPNLADRAIAFGVNNMLSNPASMVGNAISGGMETVKRPFVTALSGELGPAGADLRAMGLAVGDALADAGSTFRTGRRATQVIDQPEAFGGKAGMIATPFLRAMGATDEFLRSLNSAGAQAAELVRLKRAHPDLTQAELIERFGNQILETGQRAAAEAVFESGGTGIGQSLAGARRQLTAPDATPMQRVGGAALQVLAPFSVIPDAILTRGLRSLPGVNETEALARLARRDFRGAGDAARRAALAETTNAAIWSQVVAGNITGNGPDNPAEKRARMQARDEQGNPLWRPNSIRVGGQWVPYASLLGPAAVQVAFVANAVEQFEDSGRQLNPDVVKAFGAALGDTISDAWYLQTLSGAFSAIKNGSIPDWMSQQAASTAGRAIPEAGLLNAMRGITDPVQREARVKLDDPGTWLDYFGNRIPGVSGQVPPRIDPATGRPMQEPRDVGSLAFRATAPGEPNAANEVLARHRLGVGDAPDTITPSKGLTIPLANEDEKRQFLELSGPEVERLVVAISQNPSFQRAPDEVQKEVLEGAIRDAREIGAAKFAQTLSREELVRRMQAYDAAQKRQAAPWSP